jgi:hypothetical protein
MSESLPMVKNSPETEKDSSPNPKVAIATGFLTLITTVAVSFIGIVPQLHRGEAQEIEKLQRELNLYRMKANAPAPSASPDKKINIKGTVKTVVGGQPLAGVDVFLQPDGNNLLTTQTEDGGKFNFPGIPAGTYSIILRDSVQGKSAKVQLDKPEDEIPVTRMGARIQYLIRE